jgi:hypothetical protein
VAYTVEGTTTSPREKRSVDVRINRELSKDELGRLAVALRDEDPHYERTFITFYLPGMEVGSGGWATAHFNPDLKVVVQGEPGAQAAQSVEAPRAPAAQGGTVGRWRDARPYVGGEIVLIRDDGKFRVERKFGDGSSLTQEVGERPGSGGRRFNVRGGSYGEYYLLTSGGDLQIWDSEGLITTARKTN